jgi:hypothetical protein
MNITACGRCAALVADVEAHERWHEEVEAAVEHAARTAMSPPRSARRAS